MSVQFTSPVTLLELASMKQTVSVYEWHVMQRLWRESDTFTLKTGADEVLAITGLYRMPEGGFEAWFHFKPEARQHLRGIIRQVRLTLSDPRYSGTVTLCVTEAGKHFARLCGFDFVAQSPMVEVWAVDHGNVVRDGRAQRYIRRIGETVAANG